MKFSIKRLMAMLLSILMVVGMMPTTAFAMSLDDLQDLIDNGSGDIVLDGDINENASDPVVIDFAAGGSQSYPTLAEAFAAATDEDEIEIRTAGTYSLTGISGKNITVTGKVDGVVFDDIGAFNMGGANVTFNKVTFDYYPNVNYTGLQHSSVLVYNDCTINGQVFLYGTSETFTNCTFNQTSADAYNVWTYGAKEVEFNGCTFKSAGKSVLVYNEAGPATKLEVIDTDFDASSSVSGKAAIEIDTSAPNHPGAMDGTVITIDAETTATGFATDTKSGSSLWNDKKVVDGQPNGGTTSVVVVAGKTVKDSKDNVTYVAQIKDGASFTSLADAVAAIGSGDVVIELLADATLDITAWQNLPIGGDNTTSITINGNDHTLTFNHLNSDWNNVATNNNAKLILNNMKITNSGYNDGPWNRHDINFACDVELNNVTSDKALAFKADATLNTVAISDANTSDTYAIWIQSNGQTVTIANSTIDMLDCTDGRGIKIANEYVEDTEEKVILTVTNTSFDTEEKAAILVCSTKGADITLSEVDISGVAADTVNAVWNDEDNAAYSSKIKVIGGTIAQEMGSGDPVRIGLNGSGTETDPFVITNIDDLKWFSDDVNGGNNYSGKYVALTADIDFAGANWLEIAEDGTVVTDYRIPNFAGTFDGGDHTIKNFNYVVKQSGNHRVMMFSGTLTGVVKDLKVEKVTAIIAGGTTRVAAVANTISATSAEQARLDNVHVEDFTINCNNLTTDQTWFGGLALYTNGGNLAIEDCSVTNFTLNANGAYMSSAFSCVITPNNDFVNTTVTNFTANVDTVSGVFGGFAGQTQSGGSNASFTNCTVTGLDFNIKHIAASADNIGGFMATIGAATQFYNCAVSGTIDITEDTLTTKSVGGFIGDHGWNGMYGSDRQHEFKNCVTDVDITAVSANVGGFIGNSTIAGYPERHIPAYFAECEAKGDVKTTNGAAGGFVGIGDRGLFTNCAASGNVTGNIAGGFWGEIYPKTKAEAMGSTHSDPESKSIVLRGNTATGTVEGTEYEAGLIGFMKDIYVNNDSTIGYATPVILDSNSPSDYNRYEYPDGVDGPTVYVARIDGGASFTSLEDAVAAAEPGATITILQSGSYEMPKFQNKELTFVGADKANTSINDWVEKQSQGMSGSTVHFKNLTINGQTSNYYGLFHTNGVTYENCNINGLRFLYSPTTFTNCAFNASGVEHSFWTYGADKVTVTNCTFTYTDRAVNCYSDQAGQATDITFTGCKFTYNGAAETPAGAVEINSSKMTSLDLAMTNCVAPEKGAMWFNSQWDTNNGEKTTVKVDNVQVWPVAEPIAQVGEVKYANLMDALNACTKGETITIISDITYDEADVVNAIGGATGFGDYPNPSIIYVGGRRDAGTNYPSNVNAVIDLNGHTITNNADAYLFLIMDNAKVTFTDSSEAKTGAVITNVDAPAIWTVGTETLVTIENGNYQTASAAGLLHITHGGDMVITGGEFKTTADDASLLIMLNTHDRQNSEYFISGKATVSIKGGIFHGFNPAKVGDDNGAASIEDIKFVDGCADGYAPIANDDGTYGVVDYVKWIKEQLLAGNDVTLERDIVVDGSMIESIPAPTNGNGKYPNYAIFTVIGDEVTFDLNGHTITYIGHKDFVWNGKTYNSCTVAHGLFYANAGADLTVTDSSDEKTGTVKVYGLASGAYVASNDTTFTIEGGTWINEGCAVCGGTNIFLYPLQGGELYIKGGYFEQALDSEGESYLIVEHGGAYANSVIDYSKTKVEISGGTFVGMNPGEIKKFNQTAGNELDMTSEPTTNGCAPGFAPVENEDGSFGVVAKPVAKIGDTTYTDLQKAVDAAKTGDIVTVIADHEIDSSVTVESGVTGDKYAVLINASGKNVTIDLAGHKLKVNVGDTRLFGIFAADSGGTITLTDSSDEKTGAVNVTTGTNYLYSVFFIYDNTAKIVVEGGSYTADAVKDSLIYSQHNEIVTVKGGTFTLGNLNDANGPWIFNAKGQGDKHVIVTGGTFNADINRQKWSSEVLVHESYYTVANADGTYTVKSGAVAYVNEGMTTGPYYAPKNIGYATIDEAFAAAVAKKDSSITLLTNVALRDDVEISDVGKAIVLECGGFALDCNGHKFILTDAAATLTAVEGLNVTTTVAGCRVDYVDGTYKVAEGGIAKIGDVTFGSFVDALNAVQDGETIVVLDVEGSERKTEIDFENDITFTITGKSDYELPTITFQNATVNIVNADIEIGELDARQDATINVKNSTVETVGGSTDGIVKAYYNGKINIEDSKVYAHQFTVMGVVNLIGSSELTVTWQTNVYGNGLVNIGEDATLNTAAMHLTGQDYNDRDNTDADRVGKPAQITVYGGTLNVGTECISINGANYNYYSSEGINIGTIAGKKAVLDIVNGAKVNICMANSETANIGADGTVNVDGKLTVACRAEGGTATLVNNGSIVLKTVASVVTANECGNVTTTVDGYEAAYADGKYTLTEVEEVENATIEAKSATLLYEDMIQIRYKFDVTGEDIAEYGMLIFSSQTDADAHDAASAIQQKTLIKESDGFYYGYTDGIAAKEMGDSQFVVGYVKLKDGAYVYGDTVEYSPKIYAQRMVNKSTSSAETKVLCNALMNYGAAAQKYLVYKTDSLMNDGFASVNYDEAVLGTSIFSVNTAETNGFTTKAATLLFEGALTYRVKYAASKEISNKPLYLEYTVKGETDSVQMTLDSGYYYGYIAGIAAKDMDEALNAKPYYLDDSGNKVYGAELVYSGYEYARRTIANSNDSNSVNLAKAFAMYISAANAAISN